MMKEPIFRLYDIRGKYPNEINEGVVYKIALALVKMFGEGSNLILGYDCRNSSPIFYEIIKKVFLEQKIKIFDLRFCSSPMITYFLNETKADGAVMITASHNPKEYNGIKVFDKNGLGVSGEEIKNFYKEIDINFVNFKSNVSYFKNTEYHKEYSNFLIKFVDVNKKIKLVVDCSNGATGPIWKVLKNKLVKKGVDVVLINDNPDGNFKAHGPNPVLKIATQQIKKEIIKIGADIGLVFDGDGDRVVILDNKGERVRSEFVWRLLNINENFIKKTVFTVVDEFMFKILKPSFFDEGERLYFLSKVGHIFLRKIMKQKNADIGIEGSGHYYFKDFYYSDSGTVAGLKVISCLSKLPYSFSEFVSLMPTSTKIEEINLEVKDKDEFLLRLEMKLKKNGFKISKIDGMSAWKDDFWCNIRKSNTENIVRVNMEKSKN